MQCHEFLVPKFSVTIFIVHLPLNMALFSKSPYLTAHIKLNYGTSRTERYSIKTSRHIYDHCNIHFVALGSGFQVLKVPSCKLFNNKYMTASTQITNTEIFAFTAISVFKLLSHKILFIKRKDNRNCYKVGYCLRKQQISQLNYCKIINSWNTKFSGYF